MYLELNFSKDSPNCVLNYVEECNTVISIPAKKQKIEKSFSH